MNIIKGSNHPNFLSAIKDIRDSEARFHKEKGELVQNHLSQDVVIGMFMRSLRANAVESQKTDSFSVTTTPLPHPYPPCVLHPDKLQPMAISQMRLDLRHSGKSVIVRVLTPPDRIACVTAVVEDEEGTTVLLQLYQQPEEEVIPCAELMLDHAVAIIKEPYFRKTLDGSYSLRVDHPSDIIWLSYKDQRVPNQWKSVVNRVSLDTNDLRNEGDKRFGEKQYAAALRHYSSAIETAHTLEQKQAAYLGRALANLSLDRPAKALLDSTALNCYISEPHGETLLYEAHALYKLGCFDECNKKLQFLVREFPENSISKAELLRVESRIKEQQQGDYSFADMYEQAKATPPLVDCATFTVPVKVGDSPGRGRGLFTTRAVSAGELLLCEKAFAYSFIGEKSTSSRVLLNLSTGKMSVGGCALLLPQVVQKLFHNPQFLSSFEELHHTKQKKPSVSECDGTPLVDAFMVENIIAMNAFGCPRSSYEHLQTCVRKQRESSKQPLVEVFATAGIWMVASRINHSCIGNCRRSFIGDMLIIRATKDMPAGTELLFHYHTPNVMDSYQTVQEHLKSWGFICDCTMCKDRKGTTRAAMQRRENFFKELDLQTKDPSTIDVAKTNRLLKGMASTYNGKAAKKVRLELAAAYSATSYKYQSDGMLFECVDATFKALEAFGFTIVADPPQAVTSQARFEIREWGIVNTSVFWMLLRLTNVYADVRPELRTTVGQYAELAYTMLVGEKISLPGIQCF